MRTWTWGAIAVAMLLITTPAAAASVPTDPIPDEEEFITGILSCIHTSASFPFVVIHWHECPVVT